MPEAKFVLKEPKSKEPTLIFLLYHFNGNKVKHSTGEKIHPKFWNKTKQRVKLTREFPNGEKVNEILDNLAKAASAGYKDLLNNKKAPTPSKLKIELNKVLFKEEFAVKKGFLQFVEELIENSNRMLNTKKQWKQTFRKLKEYKNATQTDLDYDTIDLDFYNNFIHFLSKEGYTKNSIGGFIKNVKIFMNEAVDRKLTTNLEYRNRKFKVLEEQVDKIYLSEEELKTIHDLDFSNNPRLDKVKDLFLVACYTGLRFADLTQLKKENLIKNATQIKMKTQKTGETVIIPIHPYVREILAKYEGNLPNVITNQKMNDYLKEISKDAELNNSIKIEITRGGKLQNETFKKHQLVSTHTQQGVHLLQMHLGETSLLFQL